MARQKEVEKGGGDEREYEEGSKRETVLRIKRWNELKNKVKKWMEGREGKRMLEKRWKRWEREGEKRYY
jgi:hypothetical protein